MRKRLSAEHLRALSRFAVIAVIGGLAAGCSSDAVRLAGNPFSNPFSTKERWSEPRMTASVPAVPRSSIQSQPLAAPQPSYAQPAPQPRYALPKPIRQPSTPQRSAALPEPAPRQTAAPLKSGPGGWTAHGGTAVIVGPGENINSISNRYGVPASAILSASGLSKASQATAGRRLIIPVYNAGGTQIAASEPIVGREQARSQSAKEPEPKQQGRSAQPVAKAEPLRAPRSEPVQTAKAEVQQPKASTPPASTSKQETARHKEPEETASLPSASSADFRWPARGRVISGFGGPSGNEGINIAVPEGTPVKASESGTVAYAGNEVTGYGNLVLIRHDNGFVSAYAHNGEISVKRGDKVRRGQVIAKAGQTGNVTSPQLHFEIRKGSTPVDPMPHLEN